jgi:hypothetical protein
VVPEPLEVTADTVAYACFEARAEVPVATHPALAHHKAP